jgi:hypothetical protein
MVKASSVVAKTVANFSNPVSIKRFERLERLERFEQSYPSYPFGGM